MDSGPNPLVVIVGETASGKSALAIELAEKFDGEIICADSRTVYKEMDIGTAKPSPSERDRIPHHLLDVVDLDQSFSAADFKRLANQAINDVSNRGKLPVMVGGTGLYIDAVLFDYGFAHGHAKRDPRNPRHIDKSEPRISKPLRRNTLIIGLSVPKDVLERRITDRTNAMIEAGFVEEVEGLVNKYGWDSSALRAPGYQAFKEYLKGRASLREAKDLFVKNDLNLAKRQRTWFKRNKSIQWIDNPSKAVDIVTTFLSKTRN